MVLVPAVLAPESALATSPFVEESSAGGRVQAEMTEVRADGIEREHARVDVTAGVAGEPFAIYGRLVATGATTRMLLEMRMSCLDGDLQAVTTRNVVAERASVLVARWVFTAPRDGTYVCRLTSRSTIPGRWRDASAVLQIDESDSYIEATGPLSGVPQENTSADVHIPARGAADVAVFSWTAPPRVSSFRVAGDVQYTNCYDGGGAAACATSPANQRSSVIATVLQVLQLAADGGYCNVVSAPSDELQRTTITRDVHHLKVHHRADVVHVSTAGDCTRTFRIKVYVRVESGNPVVAHGRRYSQLTVYPSAPTERTVVVRVEPPTAPRATVPTRRFEHRLGGILA